MKEGIATLAQAVRMTLGPRGRAVVVEKSYGAPQVTLDGVTVAKEIELEDKFANLGADLLKQAADKTNDNVGDGTTTSVVLAHAMIEAGERAVSEQGFDVIHLADELRRESARVIKALEEQRELISDAKKIEEVATLSAKDREIGKLIATVITKVGKDGVVTIEDSNTISNTYELVEGMQIDRGYVSPYMATNSDKMEAVYEDVNILITDKKISSIKEILPLLEKLAQAGKKELVIVADDIDGEALTTLLVNRLRGAFQSLAIKAPGYGDRKKEMLEDMAILTGARVVTEDVGLKLDGVGVEVLGKARRVIATKDTTTIVGGKGKKSQIEDRVTQLRRQIENTDSSFDKEKLQERLGKLAGGVAVIKVGAPTESAQKELKQRVEDAVSATRAAMEEGIVPGGGMALFNVALAGRSGSKTSTDKRPLSVAAENIIQDALEAPIRAIAANSGELPDSVVARLIAAKEGDNKKEKMWWEGFNAETKEVEDLKKAGIIDPLKVTKTAFQNAISVAATYLTIGAAITEIPKKNDSAPANPGMGMDY
jgi:chaperonin GroEL